MVEMKESDENARWCPMSNDTCWGKDCMWWDKGDQECVAFCALGDLHILSERVLDVVEAIDELKDVMESVVTRDGDLSVVVM